MNSFYDETLLNAVSEPQINFMLNQLILKFINNIKSKLISFLLTCKDVEFHLNGQHERGKSEDDHVDNVVVLNFLDSTQKISANQQSH